MLVTSDQFITKMKEEGLVNDDSIRPFIQEILHPSLIEFSSNIIDHLEETEEEKLNSDYFFTFRNKNIGIVYVRNDKLKDCCEEKNLECVVRCLDIVNKVLH